jgi:hypothetical protein
VSFHFNAGDLSEMRTSQNAHMMDTCHRLVYSATANEYGEMVPTWTESSTDVICGLDPGPGRENLRADLVVVHHDATLRLPISTVWDVKDRIKITKRHGEAVSGVVYAIVGPIQRGPSGIRMLLEEVVP